MKPSLQKLLILLSTFSLLVLARADLVKRGKRVLCSWNGFCPDCKAMSFSRHLVPQQGKKIICTCSMVMNFVTSVYFRCATRTVKWATNTCGNRTTSCCSCPTERQRHQHSTSSEQQPSSFSVWISEQSSCRPANNWLFWEHNISRCSNFYSTHRQQICIASLPHWSKGKCHFCMGVPIPACATRQSHPRSRWSSFRDLHNFWNGRRCYECSVAHFRRSRKPAFDERSVSNPTLWPTWAECIPIAWISRSSNSPDNRILQSRELRTHVRMYVTIWYEIRVCHESLILFMLLCSWLLS